MGFQLAINNRFKIGVNGGRGDECVQMAPDELIEDIQW